MKSPKNAVIVCGVVFGLLVLGAGYFLFDSVMERSKAAEERQESIENLEKIFRSKVFPSATNIALVNADAEAVGKWLVGASNLLHKGELDIEPQTPSGFKQKLLETVRALANHPGQVNGKIAAGDFYFGFDKYLGESSVLPQDGAVATRLAGQLAIIETICKELYAAGIVEMKAVKREQFDDNAGQEEEQEEDDRASRRRNRRRGRNVEEEEKPAGVVLPSFVKKQAFEFEFIARPDALVNVLNRLAKVEPFTVVQNVEFRAVADSLATYQQMLANPEDSSPKEEKPEANDLEKASKNKVPAKPKRLIVTSPDLEPPLDVKINLDVFSFEGV